MIWRPRRLTLAAVLLAAAVPPGVAPAQTQARVLYRPPAGVAGAMTVDIAAGVLQSALTQLQLQHRGETIRSVDVQPGTIDEVFQRLKSSGLDPRTDRMYGASGPEGTAIRGVLVITTNKLRSSLIAVKSLRPSVIVDGGTTYLSGDGRPGEYSAVAAITGSADERTMRRAADALMVISLAGSLQGDVVYQRRFEEAVRSHRATAVKPAVPELARAQQAQANDAVRAHNFGLALQRFTDAVTAVPHWADGHYNLAEMLAGLEQYPNAIVEMRRYLALLPDAPDARVSLDRIREWEASATTAATIPFSPFTGR